jgi:hypothetical protein
VPWRIISGTTAFREAQRRRRVDRDKPAPLIDVSAARPIAREWRLIGSSLRRGLRSNLRGGDFGWRLRWQREFELAALPRAG